MDKLALIRLLLSDENTSPSNDAANSSPFAIGSTWLIRTVTNYRVGRIAAVYEHEIVLSESSWVCDTGRYHDALRTGTLTEVEPSTGVCVVGRGSIVDADEWKHPLPREQK